MGARALIDVSPAWRSFEAWQADARSALASEAPPAARIDASPILPGRCALCGADDGFRAPGAATDFREGLQCLHCDGNARQRAAATVLFASIAACDTARVHATEQASPFFVALHRRLPRLSGSEFAFGAFGRVRMTFWLWRHGVRTLVDRQDVTALRFGDATLDAIVSLDVLEHVPAHVDALREFARVLRPRGALVLTVPFYDDAAATVTIARRSSDGRIAHEGEPEYHGDPVNGGVLCFHHFGWDLLDAMRDAGFGDACVRRVRSAEGGLPVGQWVFQAIR